MQILCLLGWIVGERYFWQVKPFGNPEKLQSAWVAEKVRSVVTEVLFL